MAVSMKAAQISQTFAILHHIAHGVSTRSIVRTALRRYEKMGNNSINNWVRVEEDLRNAASARGGGFQEILQVVLFDARLGNGSHPAANEGDYINGTWIGGLNNPDYNGTIANGTRVNIGTGTQSHVGLLNVTGDNAIGIVLPPSPENNMQGEMMKRPLEGANRAAFWREAARNRSEGKPVYSGFAMELFPLLNEYSNPNLTGDRSQIFTPAYVEDMGGLLLGPVIINSTCAILSFTFPVFEQTNGEDVGTFSFLFFPGVFQFFQFFLFSSFFFLFSFFFLSFPFLFCSFLFFFFFSFLPFAPLYTPPPTLAHTA